MTKYFIDPYIVSVLFQTDSDERTLEFYQDLTARLGIVAAATIRSFLKGKNFPEDQIEKIATTTDTSILSPEVQALMASTELREKIEFNSDSLLKIYFEQLYPLLSTENQQELDQYIKDANEVSEMQRERMRAELQEIKDYLIETGSYSLEEALAKENANNTAASTAVPTVPSIPVVPTVPVNPVAVAIPENPAVAVIPAVPAVPVMPAAPATPVVPAVPVVPVVPAVNLGGVITGGQQVQNQIPQVNTPVEVQAAQTQVQAVPVPIPVVPTQVAVAQPAVSSNPAVQQTVATIQQEPVVPQNMAPVMPELPKIPENQTPFIDETQKLNNINNLVDDYLRNLAK